MSSTSSKVRCALIVAALALGALLGARTSHAQEADADVPPIVEAVVIEVLDEGRRAGPTGDDQEYQLLDLRLTEGPSAGRTVDVENGEWSAPSYQRYRRGDRVLLATAGAPGATAEFYITDRVRRGSLGVLFLAFVLMTVLIGRVRGALSLVAMAVSMLAIFGFVLPRILAGHDPILSVLVAALVTIPVTYYLSHGLNRKTNAAVVGTLLALLLSGLLARYAVDAAHLTGFASEDAVFLQTFNVPDLNMRGLLLASIVVGLLGVLDDITISQAAIVSQLRAASPGMSQREVFVRAMDVGKDHIASIVNTLVLVYTSSALPLLLLFHSSSVTFREAINYEIVAEEIVRTLVASIGLILAVPITTVVAARHVTPALSAADGAAHHAAHD